MPSDTPSEAQANFRTYADYLESLYKYPQPLEKYTIDFFRNGSNDKPHSSFRDGGFNVYFIDRKAASQESYSYRLFKNEPSNPDFHHTLNTVTPDTSLRVVLVEAQHLSFVDNISLDALCLRYSLEPGMLSLLFSRLKSINGTTIYQVRGDINSIPRERSFCEFSTNYLTAVATVLVIDAIPHLIVLEAEYGRVRTTTAFRESLLQCAGPNLNDPVDALCSILRIALQEAVSTYEFYAREFETRYNASPRTWADVQDIQRKLSRTLKSLSVFGDRMERELGLNTTNLRQREGDYSTLIEDYRRLGLDLQGQVQMQESRAAIKESEKAILQADAVRRLTLVAFIFIPLNFSTSFFGMNLKQLGTGSLNIGYFFLLAVLAGLVSFCLSASLKPVERFWNRERKKYLDRYEEDADPEDFRTTTKRDVLWGVAMRHSQSARTSRRIWEEAKSDLMDRKGIYERDSIGTSGIIRGWYKGVVKQLRKKPGSEEDEADY